jgi:hypothetical protein
MNYIKYKGPGEHSVRELEKIISQREAEIHEFNSCSKGIVIELNDNELKIITLTELHEMQNEAIKFDGFEAWTVRGRLI